MADWDNYLLSICAQHKTMAKYGAMQNKSCLPIHNCNDVL